MTVAYSIKYHDTILALLNGTHVLFPAIIIIEMYCHCYHYHVYHHQLRCSQQCWWVVGMCFCQTFPSTDDLAHHLCTECLHNSKF